MYKYIKSKKMMVPPQIMAPSQNLFLPSKREGSREGIKEREKRKGERGEGGIEKKEKRRKSNVL